MRDPRLAPIANDRVHGAGWLARRALGVLAGSPRERWPELAREIAALRPEMPALAAAAADAVAAGDVRTVLRRADAERRRVAAAAFSPGRSSSTSPPSGRFWPRFRRTVPPPKFACTSTPA